LLSWMNRIAVDDFYFLGNVKELGVIDATIQEYHTWSSRWFSVILTHTILFLFTKNELILFIYHICCLILFTLAVFLFLQQLMRLQFSSNCNQLKKLNAKHLINFSLFTVGIFFFSSIRIGETWFWLCSTNTYLLSTIMLFFGISGLLHPQKNVKSLLLSSIPFVYIGGSLGPLALLVLAALLTFLLCFKFRPQFVKSFNARNFYIAFICCAIAFTLLYFAPGNSNREQHFSQIDLLSSFVLNFKLVGIILIKHLPSIFPVLLFVAILFFYFGQNMAVNKGNDTWKKIVLKWSLLYFLSIFLYQWPITYKTQDIAAFRAMFYISVLTVIYTSVVFFILGGIVSNLLRQINIIQRIALVTYISASIFQIFLQRMTILEYTIKYDERINYVLNNCTEKTTITLIPLPSSGILYSAEISTEPTHFSNQHFKKGLGVDCELKRFSP
jgi:hypothetical protein